MDEFKKEIQKEEGQEKEKDEADFRSRPTQYGESNFCSRSTQPAIRDSSTLKRLSI